MGMKSGLPSGLVGRVLRPDFSWLPPLLITIGQSLTLHSWSPAPSVGLGTGCLHLRGGGGRCWSLSSLHPTPPCPMAQKG